MVYHCCISPKAVLRRASLRLIQAQIFKKLTDQAGPSTWRQPAILAIIAPN